MGIKNVSANDQGNRNMKEKMKIKDIPEGLGKGNIRKSECDEGERMNVVKN
ncbi:6798_t:CDS:1, partial [Dentiscutata heterogama]